MLTAVVSLITPSWLLLSVLQDCFTVEGEDLKHDFERLQLAMEMVGFLPATRRQWVKHTQMQRVCDDIRCWKKCKIPERLLQLRLHHHHHVVNLISKLYSNQIFIKTKEPTDWDSLQLHFHSIFMCGERFLTCCLGSSPCCRPSFTWATSATRGKPTGTTPSTSVTQRSCLSSRSCWRYWRTLWCCRDTVLVTEL